FGHASGQRQGIGRILKERVIRDLDLVVMHARTAGIEADGIGMGDEVHLVSALGQLHAQFSGDDAAAAIGRVASDPNPHPSRIAAEVRRAQSWRGPQRGCAARPAYARTGLGARGPKPALRFAGAAPALLPGGVKAPLALSPLPNFAALRADFAHGAKRRDPRDMRPNS